MTLLEKLHKIYPSSTPPSTSNRRPANPAQIQRQLEISRGQKDSSPEQWPAPSDSDIVEKDDD